MSITSLDDPRLDPYRNLRYGPSQQRCNRFIAEGRLIVERLLSSGHRCESVLVEAGRHASLVASLDPSVQLLRAERVFLRKLVGFDFHRGILACGVRPAVRSIDAIQKTGGRLPPMIIACSVNDPENLGSLIRSAAAFGVTALAIDSRTADPLSRRVLRVSMGAALGLQIYKLGDPPGDLRFLSAELGYRTVATTLAPAAVPLPALKGDRRPTAILLGNEAEGLPDAVARACTDRVTIPMRGETDSLNVAVAAAITLYHFHASAFVTHKS